MRQRMQTHRGIVWAFAQRLAGHIVLSLDLRGRVGRVVHPPDLNVPDTVIMGRIAGQSIFLHATLPKLLQEHRVEELALVECSGEAIDDPALKA
jgi:hypothetical protein